MIEPHARFEGFDARSWEALVALVRPMPRSEPTGTLIVVVDPGGAALAALHTGRGAVRGIDRADDLCALAMAHEARRALRVQRGTLEAMADRLARAYSDEDDYAAQLLEAAHLVRHYEQMGHLARWPRPRMRRPLPSRALLQRALDAVLPPHEALLIALYEGGLLEAVMAVGRGSRGVDSVLGPAALGLPIDRSAFGPTRAAAARLRALVEAHAGTTVHLGLFGEQRAIAGLLRDPAPGAWLRAAAEERIRFDPAPMLVTAGLAADGARAAAHASAELLVGTALGAVLGSLGRSLGRRLTAAPTITDILGWNPLEVLADLLEHDLDLDIRTGDDPPSRT